MPSVPMEIENITERASKINALIKIEQQRDEQTYSDLDHLNKRYL